MSPPPSIAIKLSSCGSTPKMEFASGDNTEQEEEEEEGEEEEEEEGDGIKVPGEETDGLITNVHGIWIYVVAIGGLVFGGMYSTHSSMFVSICSDICKYKGD